ncbi:Cof-type HAD-IIB family hydrolase [Paenibacillus sp. FSL M8-0334]|uniref:Cof-type HAD-IIB family hydrolase n=1 Tax=Paenibacillus campinasensis TaxID=66347 RepID=A0ABW9T8F6_9BACL|nr:Cof-type HAD-IIB family hydrolase [Paenibacillus campinasensis]MUG67476.1 Cof-type HAD-IIB family hydrolase [Paenibacillus campinasensis]
MTKRMIFFDIDGTLLDHDKQIPPSTRDSIRRLQEAGHDVAIATGRAPSGFEDVRRELNIDTYVSLNGQYVVYKGKPVYQNPISLDQLQKLTELAASHDHPLIYAGSEQMRMSVPQHVHIDSTWGELKMTIPAYDPEYYLNEPIYQVVLFCTEEEEEMYIRQFQDQIDFVRWGDVGTDALPSGGSKAEGIKRLITALGVQAEDVVAFGDYLNDVEMLGYVGHGVAMGNAPDIVKKAARYVTRAVDEDGIQHGLQMLGLLDGKPELKPIS